MSGFCFHAVAFIQPIQRADTYACPLGQLYRRGVLLTQERLEINAASVQRIFPNTALCEIVIERHQMVRAQFIQPDMSDCRQCAFERPPIPRNSRWSQLLFGIVREPLFRKLGKLHVAVQNLTVSALLLEQHGLPVKLFLDLPCRHAVLGFPCHAAAYLLAVQIIAAGNRYFVGVAAFFDGGHRITSL